MADPMEAPEVMEVETTEVACDGDSLVSGHPRVFLNMGDKGVVECPYCDRRFVLKEGAAGGSGH